MRSVTSQQLLPIAAKTQQRAHTHEMLPSWTLSQVRRARKLVYALFYFGMLTSAAFAYPANLSRPNIIHEPNRTVVIFNNTPCRPVSHQHLQMQLGQSFDQSRMALDNEGVKRSVGEKQSLGALQNDDDELDSLYQSEFDDDSPDPVADFLAATTRTSPEKTVQIQDRLSNFETDYRSKQFMRRKRDTHSLTKESSELSIYQRLIKHGYLPKRLKRKVKKSRKRKNMPWVCKMQTIWEKMDEGYFPPYIQTGYCKSSSCMYSMYQCIPKLYEIKILRRDPDRCVPVPTYGVDTTYEELWYFDVKEVTVCCECGKRKKSKKRRQRKGH